MAAEALGNRNFRCSITTNMFQTYCMFCNRFINGAKERTHALSVTSILRNRNEKELFWFENTGANGLVTAGAIGLFWFGQNQRKISRKEMQSKDLMG